MKKYVFKPYNPNFPHLFALEKKRIVHSIHEYFDIQHVGSTAIPGLGGKGIIDIAIAVPKNSLETTYRTLENLGYTFRESGSAPERLFFRADLPDEEETIRRYHVHLTFPESSEWRNLLAFRDYLKMHPEAVKDYAKLKKEASLQVNENGVEYRRLKEPFFTAILANALETELCATHKLQFTFRPVETKDRALVHAWLAQPHVARWFYGQGLENTFRHLDEFLQGSIQSHYWLACDQEHPFAFFITSPVQKPNDELAHWCVEEGEAITLDMLIGDINYLGKGLSHLLIRDFLISQFPEVTEVLIDPEATNSHAIHIYKKVGFVILGEFIPSHNPHPHYMMRLNMKDLHC